MNHVQLKRIPDQNTSRNFMNLSSLVRGDHKLEVSSNLVIKIISWCSLLKFFNHALVQQYLKVKTLLKTQESKDCM